MSVHLNEFPVKFEFQKVHPAAQIPSRKRDTDAGYDLTTIGDYVLAPRSITEVETGLIVTAPPGYFYTAEGRSSLIRVGVVPFRSIIDATYTGQLIVGLMNLTDKPYTVNKGDRIAQIIVHRAIDIKFVEVEEFSPEYNQRGTNGFGSSGR